MRTAEPVAVGHPELAPFVGRLDVVVVGEPLIEPSLGLIGVSESGRGECEDAISGGLLIAITEMAAVLECDVGFGKCFEMAAERQVALGTTPPQLGNDVALWDQGHRLLEHGP